MKRSEKLAEIDMSALNTKEREALEHSLKKHSVAWPMALICAALSSVALVVVLTTGAAPLSGTTNIMIKIVGFLGLGYWARNWSIPAAICLLAWHLYMNQQYAFAERLQFKLQFWIPALVFAWACLGAFTQVSLMKKAEQGVGVDAGHAP